MAPNNTLRHVTKRKLEKLADHVTKHEARERAILQCAATKPSLREEVKTLLQEANAQGLLSDHGETRFKQVQRFLDQAEHDPSLSDKQIEQWRNMIMREIDIRGRKLSYAKLFGTLCDEWAAERLRKAGKSSGISGSKADARNDHMHLDNFESSSDTSFVDVKVQERQREARVLWEQYAFDGCQKDQTAIDAYLKDIFGFTRSKKLTSIAPLHQLQLAIGRFDETEPKRINSIIVEQCIDGLLRADFFVGTKRQELLKMRDKPEVLAEISDVLNMDLESVESWNWEKPVPLSQRRMLNGKYRVFYDEEVHQAIFLQFIGLKWAVLMKNAFTKFFHSGAWTQAPFRAMDKLSKQRRDYFLGTRGTNINSSVRANRRSLYQNHFFMLQLPSSMEHSHNGYGDDGSVGWDAVQREFGAEWHNPELPGQKHNTSPKHPAQKKDLLHRLVTTEMLVQTAVYGECTILQSDFKEYGTSIPHDTIFAVLKFLGVKKKWLDFFRKFLTPMTYWADDVPEGSDLKTTHCKRRQRGVPMTHVLSDALSEAILFCLDFAVSKTTDGIDRWRFHDDLWFWGQEEVVVKAWGTMQDFSALMGLQLNNDKTGCVQTVKAAELRKELSASLPRGDVTWGFLKLDSESSSWKLHEIALVQHFAEVEHRLETSMSIFEWIEVWNSFACRFFSANLGQPATCFGVAHSEYLLDFYAKWQNRLMDNGGNVHQHLREMLEERSRDLDVKKIPDAFFYFPNSLGGLGLQNPFVRINAIRPNLPQDPVLLIRQAFERDQEDYYKASRQYENGEFIPQPYHANTWAPESPKEDFMSLDEFIKFREECSPHLANSYDKLLGVPDMVGVEASVAVKDAVDDLSGERRWHDLSVYEQWMFELYGREIIDLFGGLALADKNMLPLAMMESLHAEKVR